MTEEIRKADPGVRKVILFGSVATGAVGSERFDIDLALLGGDQLKLMTVTEESSFAVDLVDLEAVSTGFRQRVEERGEVLYDAQQ